MTLESMIFFGGILHLTLLAAGALVPKLLDWREGLSPLSPFLRRLMWVYAAFVFLMILAFGSLSLLHAGELAARGPLARSLCAVIALCWIVRLAVQWFVFDVAPLGLGRLTTAGYHGLTAIFVVLVAIYGWAAVGGA